VQRINLEGVLLCAKYAIPYKPNQNYGRICIVHPYLARKVTLGKLPTPSVKQAAFIGLTKVVGKEYAETSITVTVNGVPSAVIAAPMVAAVPKSQVYMMTARILMKRTSLMRWQQSVPVLSVTGLVCMYYDGDETPRTLYRPRYDFWHVRVLRSFT
jgi:3-oxoacyl-[acyl-carrier protein] reductase